MGGGVQVAEVPSFSRQTHALLGEMIDDFTIETALRVKKVIYLPSLWHMTRLVQMLAPAPPITRHCLDAAQTAQPCRSRLDADGALAARRHLDGRC